MVSMPCCSMNGRNLPSRSSQPCWPASAPAGTMTAALAFNCRKAAATAAPMADSARWLRLMSTKPVPTTSSKRPCTPARPTRPWGLSRPAALSCAPRRMPSVRCGKAGGGDVERHAFVGQHIDDQPVGLEPLVFPAAAYGFAHDAVGAVSANQVLAAHRALLPVARAAHHEPCVFGGLANLHGFPAQAGSVLPSARRWRRCAPALPGPAP